MRRLGLIAVLGLLACEQAPSKLDNIAKPAPGAEAPPSEPHTGSIEERLAKLEQKFDKYNDMLEAILPEFEQQKAQMEQQKKARAEEEENSPAPDATFAVDVANDVKAGQVDGPNTALVTVIKYFDFACPFCEQTASTMDDLVKDYGGKVRVVYKNFVIHGPALPAHMGSCAAAKQGKYLAFKRAFWEKGFGPYKASQGRDQSSLSEDSVIKIATDLGLDAAKFKTDMHGDDCKKAIQDDMADGEKWHVNATPSFYINGTFVQARSKDDFKKVIDDKLKIAEASGVAGADYYAKEIVGKGEKTYRAKKDPKPN